MILNDAELAALEADTQNIGVFFRLDTDTPVRLWLGFGSIEVAACPFDPDGGEYIGFGELTDFPALNQMINGAASRVEFTLTGVTGDVLAIASGDDAENIKGAAVPVGIAFLGPDWQPLGDVHTITNYTADFLSVQQAATTDPKAPIIRRIVMSCGSRMTGRRRPGYSYFSDRDQQARSPGDLFCSIVGRYAHGFVKKWPVFT